MATDQSSYAKVLFRVDGQVDGKGGSLSWLRCYLQRAAMLVDDYIPGNGQSLPGPLADLLGGKEGIKNPA